MDFSDIQAGLKNFVDKLDSQTYLGTFRETSRYSLVKTDTTRANTLWKMAEYVIARIPEKPTESGVKEDHPDTPEKKYLDGWRTIAARFSNQYLLLELTAGHWAMYDAQGVKLGEEEYIEQYLKSKTKKYNVSSVDDALRRKLAEEDYQIIYYGAPGTGKSNKIKKFTEPWETRGRVIRTTFYPDSDYSTFVGAYKPTIQNTAKEILGYIELKNVLKTYLADGKTYPIHRFAFEQYESLKLLSSKDREQMLDECGKNGKNDNAEFTKIIGYKEQVANPQNNEITYRFVPQAFINAYIDAWKNLEEPEFLIIEEINRGNCAQIFGDLFQLLDRNEKGESNYAIKADTDLQAVLADAFQKTNLPQNIKSGSELLLPSNLYIWATMNTSDQSLFPIDSAFKRRWSWEYIPIVTPEEYNLSNRKIVIVLGQENGDYEVLWSTFINAINKRIISATKNEDKQLGFFFCRPKREADPIDAKNFVGKVVFYLWQDVFKTTSSSNSVFNFDGKMHSFADFYQGRNINNQLVADFIKAIIQSGD